MPSFYDDSGDMFPHGNQEEVQGKAASLQAPDMPVATEDTHHPIELIRVLPDQTLHVQPPALAFIRTLRKPVYVISVAGVAREGKSAFLSSLLRIVQTGVESHACRLQFSVSSGVQTHTQGAWVWGTNHFRTSAGYQAGSLLLIDTQA